MDDFDLDAELALEEELFSNTIRDQDDQPPDDVDTPIEILQTNVSNVSSSNSKVADKLTAEIALNRESVRSRE